MDDKDVEIRILEEEVAPIKPETGSKISVQAAAVAQRAREQTADAVQKAWQSEARKKVTRRVGQGAKKVVQKGGQAVSDVVVKTAERQARERTAVVQQRLRETDWKEVAKTGTATGLRWMSRKLAHLAARFNPQDKE